MEYNVLDFSINYSFYNTPYYVNMSDINYNVLDLYIDYSFNKGPFFIHIRDIHPDLLEYYWNNSLNSGNNTSGYYIIDDIGYNLIDSNYNYIYHNLPYSVINSDMVYNLNYTIKN
jgi:hypothetical protein